MWLDVEGQRTFAYTGGRAFDATLPVVVFLHGACNDHSVWTLLARWCAHHGHAVLAPDLPGHLRSAGPPLPEVQAMGRWTLALLDAAGVPAATRVRLVGHSMGSLAALEAAAQQPRRAAVLVMVGTAYPMQVSDALLATAAETPERAMAQVTAWSHAGLASKPSYPGPGSWLHGAGMALQQRVQAAAGMNLFHHDFSACGRYAGGMDAAARVRCPVHFILGAADRMTPPRAAQPLARALNATVHTVASGHFPMTEAPDATLAALRLALVDAHADADTDARQSLENA